MGKGLEARLKRLEGRRGKPLVIILRRFGGSELIGYSVDGGATVLRRPEESEEALLARAEAVAAGAVPRNGMVLMVEMRAQG